MEISPLHISNDHYSILNGRFTKLIKLGEGTYGVVFKAKDNKTQQTVAIKKIRLEHDQDGIPATAIREISLLKEISNNNIVKLNEVFFDEGKLYLVFEYMEADLQMFIERNKKGISPGIIRSFLHQILSALDFCHSHRIIHRDLKPQNILVDKNGTIKLADFGLARTFGIPLKEMTHEVVTLWYRAPEILLGQKDYSLPVDMWSVGCIFAHMALGRSLFCGDSEIGQIFKIFQILGTPDDLIWPGISKLQDYKMTFPKWKAQPLVNIVTNLDTNGIDLLEKMLFLDPQKRINSRDALRHPYFEGFDSGKYMEIDNTSFENI